MFSKLSGVFHALAKGWLIVVLLAVFVPYILTTIPVLKTVPGGDITSLDSQVFYTPDQAFATVGSYGENAHYWIRIYLTWDLINPVMYALIFSIVISWLFQRSFTSQSVLRRFNILPLAAGLADLLENVSIVIMLSVYPARPVALAWASTIFTVTKMVFFAGSVLLILLGTFKASFNRFRKIAA